MKRKIKFWLQRRTRGWSDDECWNLDVTFIYWLNEHLKVYKRTASEYIDLNHHTFKYKNKEYTQLELINKLINLTDEYKKLDFLNEQKIKIVNEVFVIFKLIYWMLWW